MTLRPVLAALACILILSPLAHAQQTVLPLWPTGTPEPAQTTAPEGQVKRPETPTATPRAEARHFINLTNITIPTLSVYPPRHARNTGAAALVFPGGGYHNLAMTKEGYDTCQWLNAIGITCLLVKYRVPQTSVSFQVWYPGNSADLEDAQQAMRMARAHARAWHIDPNRIGVVGYSAGGNLAVLLSTHPDDHHVESTPAAKEVDPSIDARANFAIVVYPAYLGIPPDLKQLNPIYTPNQFTPPTFLLQAENDRKYGKNAPLYYQALALAYIPSELHMFATGGHGFGVDPVGKPEARWTDLADAWLRSINMIPPRPPDTGAPDNLMQSPSSSPCPLGTANAGSQRPNSTNASGQPCYDPMLPH